MIASLEDNCTVGLVNAALSQSVKYMYLLAVHNDKACFDKRSDFKYFQD